MDAYILKVLNANAEAKKQVQETLDAHADDIKELNDKKKEIDKEVAAFADKEIAEVNQQMILYQQELQPIYDKEYEERVSGLVNRFVVAKEEWLNGLLDGIVNLDDK